MTVYKLKDFITREVDARVGSKHSVSLRQGFIGRVVEVTHNGIYTKDGDLLTFHNFESIRHSTPEEIENYQQNEIWSNLGRVYGKFIVGDILMDQMMDLYYVNDELINEKDIYSDAAEEGFKLGLYIRFWPADSHIEL